MCVFILISTIFIKGFTPSPPSPSTVASIHQNTERHLDETYIKPLLKPLPIRTLSVDETLVKRKIDRDETRTIAKKSKPQQLSWGLKRMLLSTDVEYPLCMYPNDSRRKQLGVRETVNLTEYLKPIQSFNKHRVICVDGMNGTGKSTMTKNVNRAYCKINIYCPNVTSGSDYNFYIMNALHYINHRIIFEDCGYDDTKTTAPTIWDRDRYSNLRFYFVHHLMYEYRNRTMSMDSENEIYEKLNTLALGSHLLETLTYFEKIKPSPPTLIMICSDLHLLGQLLLLRGGVSDTVMSKNLNYQVAQYHVYRYFAKIMRTPIFDIAYMSKRFNMTMNEIQLSIVNCIDYVYNDDVDVAGDGGGDNGYDTTKLNKKDYYETFIRLKEFCKNNNDRALYTYSLK